MPTWKEGQDGAGLSCGHPIPPQPGVGAHLTGTLVGAHLEADGGVVHGWQDLIFGVVEVPPGAIGCHAGLAGTLVCAHLIKESGEERVLPHMCPLPMSLSPQPVLPNPSQAPSHQEPRWSQIPRTLEAPQVPPATLGTVTVLRIS